MTAILQTFGQGMDQPTQERVDGNRNLLSSQLLPQAAMDMTDAAINLLCAETGCRRLARRLERGIMPLAKQRAQPLWRLRSRMHERVGSAWGRT